MSGFTLDGYTTVNQRILTFFDKYPTGIISTHPAKIVTLGDHTFISVVAEVNTTADAPPVLAEAWEIFPGKTPYTRDSEMMNAATSAIGRALMQLGIGIDKAAASADEVRVAQERRQDTHSSTEPTRKDGKRWKASEKQIEAVKRMMGTIPQHHKIRFLEATVGKTAFEDLVGDDVDLFFTWKSAGVVERYQALSDIWAQEPEDDPWAVEGM